MDDIKLQNANMLLLGQLQNYYDVLGMFHIRHVGHNFRGIDLYFANSLRQPEFMCHLTNIKILTDNHSAKIDFSLPVAVCMKHKSLKHPLGFAEAQQSITT